MAETPKAPLSIAQIAEFLPHRYPFLLVDRIVELSETRVVGIKNVTINEPFFAGHFPDHPVMPGVLIVEAMVQAGAFLALTSAAFDRKKQDILFMAMDKVKFRKPVVPGDQLHLEVVPLRAGQTLWKMRGEARVDGELVSEGEFLATTRPK